MKIFTENSVYVQMSDINYLVNDRSIVLPQFITRELYGWSFKLRLIDRFDENRFVRFIDSRSREWFLDDDLILDYNDVVGLDEQGVQELIDKLYGNYEDIGTKAWELLEMFEDLSSEEKAMETDKLNLSIDNKELIRKSLYAYLNYLEGRKRIRFPKEVKVKSLRPPFLRLSFRKSNTGTKTRTFTPSKNSNTNNSNK